jgi:penicillin-binding protein 1A
LAANIQIGGKTGTGDSFVDAWFVGFGSGIVICVWMGNDTPRSMPSLYGGTGPARVFNRIVHDLVEHTETARWTEPLP